jgi:NTP pyrophosphatase (non-canonical NTP hydrolase)
VQVKELQSRVTEFTNKWYEKRDYEPDQLFTLVHLLEEFGELAREYVSFKIRPEKYDVSKLENGIADMFLQLIGLASQRNLDVEELILRTIDEDLPRVS